MTKTQLEDPRREKRFFRRSGQSETYLAYLSGQGDGHYGGKNRNPYPPGARFNAYEDGYKGETE